MDQRVCHSFARLRLTGVYPRSYVVSPSCSGIAYPRFLRCLAPALLLRTSITTPEESLLIRKLAQSLDALLWTLIVFGFAGARLLPERRLRAATKFSDLFRKAAAELRTRAGTST